ncbi:2-hydroxyacid dehydrogenase [Thiomicrospira sp. WB1]|uniref:2-hydroxyacid dehydrogenase n=1 Tax=Thiomicrospira sp. WB1 TaxID=1685380 RepID=UPI000747D6D6|nr:2-hydroxyacid dehydrogenase [Thiomicrospira sp. WB1]KUJ72905.1 hydroxyacid dehydrogenase [Thiomicrospira sp. WB1]
MKVACFSTTKTDKRQFEKMLTPEMGIDMDYFDVHLSLKTVPLAHGFDAICAFVNDHADADVMAKLSEYGVNAIVLRCAGFNNVDAKAAEKYNIQILRVPAYSPQAVAEHALALIMTLNRKTHKSFNRVRDGNFTLEGLLGFDLFEKTAGVIGTGRIGQEAVRILRGLGLNVLAYDPYPNDRVTELGAKYVGLDEIYAQSDIITLHVPLLPQTEHMINREAIAKMKPGVMLINTSRGGLMEAKDLIHGLKSGQIGYLGIDVYEQEDNLFFEDHSEEIIHDDVFERLITFPNVLITAHQAFFTQEALDNITATTLDNLKDVKGGSLKPERCVRCEG